MNLVVAGGKGISVLDQGRARASRVNWDCNGSLEHKGLPVYRDIQPQQSTMERSITRVQSFLISSVNLDIISI